MVRIVRLLLLVTALAVITAECYASDINSKARGLPKVLKKVKNFGSTLFNYLTCKPANDDCKTVTESATETTTETTSETSAETRTEATIEATTEATTTTSGPTNPEKFMKSHLITVRIEFPHLGHGEFSFPIDEKIEEVYLESCRVLSINCSDGTFEVMDKSGDALDMNKTLLEVGVEDGDLLRIF